MKAKALIPLALFLLLVVFLAIGLTRDPREIPSPLIDKPAPDFTLPVLATPDRQLKLADMQGAYGEETGYRPIAGARPPLASFKR